MTVGKDVSMLFTDVLNCMQTKNLELKKLVYLYIMNYAKTHPDRVVLAVNTFQIDAADPNPLVRALAIRTMGQIRVEEIAEHLCQPLQKTMKDPDPYVRKTAAICVAKLFDLNPELVESMGFLESLNGLLADANPMVVANAVAALAEIDDMSDKEVFRVTEANLSKLQAALNLATEWGQVFILNALAKYVPRSSDQAEQICERVVPRLQHANAAVVLGAVRVIMLYLEKVTKQDAVDALQRKLGPPLVTLLAKEPEIQYVALRNIHLVVQKRPAVLAHELKVFFCKYNDPIYVKMEKLEILIMLANDGNVEQVLMELKEYSTEVDVEFVRKAVRAIGRCAIKIEPAAKRCVGVLLELIGTKVNYVVQEGIVVIRDIFRRYPNTYEAVIANLCENLETLDEPEAKAAMIWIIGEYADRIDNADELLESFLDNFADEPAAVQLQLLTAVVKLFLKRPKKTQALVKTALDLATEKSDNPDLRDRGFVYWRLLATNPAAAKAVVLAEKPLIRDTTSLYEQSLLDELVANISTLASVYHKPPESFVSKMKGKEKTFKHRQARAEANRLGEPDDDDADDDEPSASGNASTTDNDLLGLGDTASSSAPSSAPAAAAAAPAGDATRQPTLWLPAASGGGLAVMGVFSRNERDEPVAQLALRNESAAPLSGFAIQFNKNVLKLTPVAPLIDVAQLAPGQTATAVVALKHAGNSADPKETIDVAFKHNGGIFYGVAKCPLWVGFEASGKLVKQTYLEQWKSLDDDVERRHQLSGCSARTPAAVSQRLGAHNVFEVAQRPGVAAGETLVYASAAVDGIPLLFEFTLNGSGEIRLALKTMRLELEKLAVSALHQILK
jgi:AP-1 complex subunit beta-1